MSNLVEESGKQSFRDLLISGQEILRDDIRELRNDLAGEKESRGKAEKEVESRLATLETKMMFYSGFGSLLGGALVAAITRMLHI